LVVTRAFYNRSEGGFKLGVDLAGGTIVVYEVDPEKKPPEGFKIDQLAERLKRRIDPADLYNVTVRGVAGTRVEVILPFGGTAERRGFSAPEVDRVKELISRVGSLRFLILANTRDDKDAIDEAKRMYGSAMTAELRATLKKIREEGVPPPPPTSADGEEFTTPMGRYSYTWVEMGPKMRHQYRLENAVEALLDNDGTKDFWLRMKKAREKDEVVEQGGLLFYSREVPAERDARLPKREQGKKYEYFIFTRDPEKPIADHEVTGKYLRQSTEGPDEKGGLAVHFTFDTEGGNRFYDLTSKNKPDGGFYRHLAIVLDDLIMSAPTINSPIRESGQISGNFTKPEVDQLVNILRSGALPATLKPLPVSESSIGATLGADTIKSGFYSVVLAFAAVLLFMLFYYRFAGLVACLALFANLLLTVAVMVQVHATFTLPGLAGLVLMLGMAVDANVLIYERLREERERGAGLALAIRNGYDRAFPTIIDTHLSSIFTAIVLYVVGNDQLKGFGISLTLGLIISLFTSLFMTRLMFDFWQARGWLRKLNMLKMFSRPNIDFMAIRYYWFTATVILTILGASLFLYRGRSGLNIDFTGGTLYSGQLTQEVDLPTLRKALGEEAQEKRLKVAPGGVQPVEGSEGRSFLITYEGSEPRRVNLPNRDTPEKVLHRAEHLEDFALEQTALGASSSDTSKYFTIRTSERAPELVQAAINRLLDDPSNTTVRLRKINMAFDQPRADPETKKIRVDLTFTDPEEKDKRAETTVSQVRRLLEPEFEQAGGELKTQSKLFTLQGVKDEDQEQQERFSRMVLIVNPVDVTALKQAMQETAKEFSARPQPERLENFDSQLAEETQGRALYAILASWGAILLYLWFRFGNWTFGLAAVLCLVHDLFFTLGIITVSHYLYGTVVGNLLSLQDFKIDLPAVAALLTLVGYSVNDTIVVFDRIREVRGKNPELTPKMINDSVNQTLSRTLLASLTTWLVVIVLYIFGGEGVHLFAFVMVVGVIVGTYSSIYIASPLLLLFGEGVKPARAGQPQAVSEGARA
jgi:SecD/SecF fusion protein